MNDVTHRDLIRFAADLERSATGMMRASINALATGDKTGCQREQTIAAREYEWAANLWNILGQRPATDRCRAAHDAVLVGEWQEPAVEPS